MLAAEDWVPEDAPKWAKFTNWFLRMRAFEYMAIGFMCLTYDRTMRYWGSIYYICHIVAIAILIGGKIYRHSARRKKLQLDVDATAKVAASQHRLSLSTRPDKLHTQ